MTIRLAILGSTGSIGQQTLDVVREHPEAFDVVALAAGGNLDLLTRQVQEFQPRLVSTAHPSDGSQFPGCTCVCSDEGLLEVATCPEADIVVVATTGHSAIKPALAAIRQGKQLALANKEVIVCAGELLINAAKQAGSEIRPIDSEHSAIWQSLMSSNNRGDVECITLTASGGALRNLPVDQLASVTAEQALAHPNWSMGRKVTIDSATLMNKGLEVIEAHWLFGTSFDQIDVVIHPQSIIHSLVTFVDGSTIAQLGLPDMRVPIQYALTYPDRLPSPGRQLNLSELGALEFASPDRERYPALELAFEAGRAGATYPTVLSAADEIAVDAFLNGRIAFGEIVSIVQSTVDGHHPALGELTLEAIEQADQWARQFAEQRIIRAHR